MRRLDPAPQLLLLAIFVAICSASSAQEAREARPVRVLAGVPAVDTVRVVRDRLPADLLGAPMATSEIRKETLRSGRQIGLDEALDMVPGTLAQSRSGGQDVRITIRGFGARGAGERSNAGTTRGIRILLDGFPITEPDGRTSLDLADLGALDRVRVVRSNSSVLFGSASGGLIDLVTHAPFGSPFYDVRTSFGSFGLQRTHANAGLLLGSGRLRLSVSDTRFDGWRRHSESTTSTMQASYLVDPGPRTALGVYLAATRNHIQQPGALTRAEMDADPRQADPTYVARNDRRENNIGRVGLRLQQGLRERDVLVLSGFVEPKSLHRSERNRFRDFTRYHVGGSAVYQMAMPWNERLQSRLDAGVDEAFQDGTVLFYDLGPGGTRGTQNVANKREAIHNFGGFAELHVQPTTAWELSAGARYDLVRYVFEDYQAPKLDDARTMNTMSPRVSAAYEYRRGQKVFAALSGGIEAPAFNEIDPPAPFDTLTGLNPFLRPARSLTIEMGTKGLVLLGSDGASWVRYDAALYGLEVRNDIIPVDGGAYYLTAGKSRRAGAELGAQLFLRQGLSARLACTVSHNEYVDYVNKLGDFAGKQSAGVAPLVLDARLGYETRFGAYAEGVLRTLGGYFADDANSVRVPGFQVVDLTVGARRGFGRAALDAFVSAGNMFDRRYVSSAFINGANGRFFEPGIERNVLVGLGVRSR